MDFLRITKFCPCALLLCTPSTYPTMCRNLATSFLAVGYPVSLLRQRWKFLKHLSVITGKEKAFYQSCLLILEKEVCLFFREMLHKKETNIVCERFFLLDSLIGSLDNFGLKTGNQTRLPSFPRSDKYSCVRLKCNAYYISTI